MSSEKILNVTDFSSSGTAIVASRPSEHLRTRGSITLSVPFRINGPFVCSLLPRAHCQGPIFRLFSRKNRTIRRVCCPLNSSPRIREKFDFSSTVQRARVESALANFARANFAILSRTRSIRQGTFCSKSQRLCPFDTLHRVRSAPPGF